MLDTKENRAGVEERPSSLTDADEFLARFFDVLIEMDFEQQHKQQDGEKSEDN